MTISVYQLPHPSRILTMITVILSFIIAILVAIIPIGVVFEASADLFSGLMKAMAVLEALIIILGTLGLMIGTTLPRAPADVRGALYGDLWFVSSILLGLGAMSLPWGLYTAYMSIFTGIIGFALGTITTVACLVDKEVAAEVMPYWRAFIIMAIFYIIVFIVSWMAFGWRAILMPRALW